MTDWNEIVSAHQSKLWRTAYRILANRDDSLECCQEALLDAYRYSQENSIDNWDGLLVSLTARRAIDRLRQRVRRRDKEVGIEHVEEPTTLSTSPIANAEASELVEQLREAIREIPVKQSRVFWLCCVEGLSHEDISRHLQISINESRVLLHRARSRLANSMAQLNTNARSQK
ncbi:sigma-70 family RNA polymerase sigma factor [Mariniblastus sp.]|nr:sigma-70 family RNA polymerase sigma factor [Mariniblastus sp.]